MIATMYINNGRSGTRAGSGHHSSIKRSKESPFIQKGMGVTVRVGLQVSTRDPVTKKLLV
jgi:hypothetical protein